MNTEEIIESHVRAIASSKTINIPASVDISSWVDYYRQHSVEMAPWLPINCPTGESLKTDALVKIMTRAFLAHAQSLGPQMWNRDYVRSTYGACVEDCHFIYYPASAARRLIVNFSSMGQDRFDRYSRHWDPTQRWEGDTAYLFFKDDNFSYFLGTDDKPMSPIINRIIRHFRIANALSDEQVFTVGGSMGGYGALFYALTLGLSGAIVCSPQVNRRALHAHAYQNWTRNARSTGTQWIDLDMLVHRVEKTPHVYIEVGQYPSDQIASEALITALSKKPGLLIHRRASWSEHTRNDVLPKELIDQTIAYFETNNFVASTYC